MAKIIEIEKQKDELASILARTLQSGHINYLVGSGASQPAIRISGNIEREIDALFKAAKNLEAQKKVYDFLCDVQIPNNGLISNSGLLKGASEDPEVFKSRSKAFETTKQGYRGLLSIIETILVKRKTSLLPRQANIFSTNYDLFIEDASRAFPAIRLNDGFVRSPSLTNQFKFSSMSFFNSVSNAGNLYNYRVEIPSVNLIKIHGSLSWKKMEEDLVFESPPRMKLSEGATDEEIATFNSEYALILPQQGKFRETCLDRIYYDLLRIYSNELDKENVILFAVGFSFDDEHISEITKRALKNPTLLLVISAFDQASVKLYSAKFEGYSNVMILAPEDKKTISLADFNQIIRSVFEFKLETTDER